MRHLFTTALLWTALVLASGQTIAAPQTNPFVVGLAGSINDGPSAIPLAKWVNATSIRLDAPWSQIEPSANQFLVPPWLDQQISLMTKNGIEPMLILAYGNPIYGIKKPLDDISRTRFGNYSEWIVKRLKGRVKYFQLWNEWETRTGGGEPGSAEEYVQLAQTVVPRLRVANPEAVIIANGLSYPGLTSSWANTFVKMSGHQLFDGIAAHPYVWQLKRNRRPEAAIELLEKFSEKATTAEGKRMPMYVTEFGYPDFDNELGTPTDLTVQLMSRFLLLASSKPWIAGVWWYGLRDQGSDRSNREHGFGIFDRDMRPKSTARALKELVPHLTSSQRGTVAESAGALVFHASDTSFKYSWKPEELLTNQLGVSAKP